MLAISFRRDESTQLKVNHDRGLDSAAGADRGSRVGG